MYDFESLLALISFVLLVRDLGGLLEWESSMTITNSATQFPFLSFFFFVETNYVLLWNVYSSTLLEQLSLYRVHSHVPRLSYILTATLPLICITSVVTYSALSIE